MSEHTPKPWEVRKVAGGNLEILGSVKEFHGNLVSLFAVPSDGDVHFHLDQEGCLCATLAYDAYYQFPPDTFRVAQEANARLMALAPELLDELKAMLATHSSEWAEGCGIQNGDGWMDARKRAVALIAKAEGGGA